MKTRSFAIAVFCSLASLATIAGASAARADGFRCEGQGFHVKLFNQVRPEHGTRNPAVLIFSQEQRGTLATFRAPDEIRKILGPTTVVFQGRARDPQRADIVALQLTLDRVPVDIAGQPVHRGSVDFIGGPTRLGGIPVLCSHYLKWPPQFW